MWINLLLYKWRLVVNITPRGLARSSLIKTQGLKAITASPGDEEKMDKI